MAKTTCTKTIFMMLILCAAIMSSVVIYYAIHPVKQSTLLSANEGMMFKEARDIKPFELIASDGSKFTKNDFLNHWTLVFFGFTHCSTICPTTLNMLSHVYDKLYAIYPNLQVVLISLDPERDTPEVLSAYTNRFSAHFMGVTGSHSELRKLQAQLGIASERHVTSANGDYQIQHTSSILLINPQAKWAGLFRYGMKPAQFVSVFSEWMQKQA